MARPLSAGSVHSRQTAATRIYGQSRPIMGGKVVTDESLRQSRNEGMQSPRISEEEEAAEVNRIEMRLLMEGGTSAAY